MKEVKKPFLTPENVLDDENQMEYQHTVWCNELLNLHMEINSVLSEATCEGIDAGGQYAAFLNNIGLEHETEEGWWNQTAVDHDNLQFFVDFWWGDEDNEKVVKYLKVKESYKQLPKPFRNDLKGDWFKIEDYLEEWL